MDANCAPVTSPAGLSSLGKHSGDKRTPLSEVSEAKTMPEE